MRWSERQASCPTIPHLAAAAADTIGGEPAILDQGETWTYATLWQQVEACAGALIDSGIRHGERVAIWAPNSREWIVAALGAMTAGAALVPLNTRFKGREAGDILRRTQTVLLFTVGEFLGTDYSALLADQALPAMRQTLLLDTQYDSFLASAPPDGKKAVAKALAALGPDDISDIMFTSGTTGQPKGAVTTHGRTLPLFRHWVDVMALGAGERYLAINPFFHTFGYKAGWLASIIAGACLVPMRTFDLAQAAAHIERDQIAFLPGPPTIYQSLLARMEAVPFDVSSLRGAATGAASVPPELVRRMRSELGLIDTVTAYGMTEHPCITTCRRGDPSELIARSCGVALPGLEIEIRDDAGAVLPSGEAGEICVRGDGVMLGYLDDPVATAEAIDADGWLLTGDIGVLDNDGYLQITDRKKDMYISGGFNVYPAEVENILIAHPAIAASAIVAVPDERMGDLGKAFVVLRPGAQCDADELRSWCRGEMANYKVPASFVFLDDLPKNASGKVMKTQLRAM